MTRSIFLDCGTHLGQGLVELIVGLEGDWEVHCFEPNPMITEEDLSALVLKDLIETAGCVSSSVTLHRAAVWKEDGTISFACVGGYPRGNPNGKSQGSSIADAMQHNAVATLLSNTTVSDVPCVDFSRFISELSALDDSDVIYVKMDIEGAEYQVVRRMIEQPSCLRNIKKMWIEWHPHYFAGDAWERSAKEELVNSLQDHGIEVNEWG